MVVIDLDDEVALYIVRKDRHGLLVPWHGFQQKFGTRVVCDVVCKNLARMNSLSGDIEDIEDREDIGALVVRQMKLERFIREWWFTAVCCMMVLLAMVALITSKIVRSRRRIGELERQLAATSSARDKALISVEALEHEFRGKLRRLEERLQSRYATCKELEEISLELDKVASKLFPEKLFSPDLSSSSTEGSS